jgi:ABC-type lipoprotein release transport system permease subunit
MSRTRSWEERGAARGLLLGFDGLSLGGATLALASVVVLASLLPAWRTSRADPALVLRQE